MDLLGIISKELDEWEQRKQLAVQEFTRASNAIEALWQLTERMKEAANVTDYQSSGEEKEAASGD